MPHRTPFAAIFDWDGVIIDSSFAHEKSWDLLAAQEGGLPLPAGHFKAGFGRRNETIIPEILGWTKDPAEIERLANRKEALYRAIMRETLKAPLPGVRDLLENLRGAGIPCVVGSSTHRENVHLAMDLLGIRPYFHAIVCGEDVKRGKPAPDVFLKAAEAAGCKPGAGVVFEDAPVGIEAALAGGFAVFAVTTSHPAQKLAALHPTRIIRSLAEVNAADVAAALGWSEVLKHSHRHPVSAG